MNMLNSVDRTADWGRRGVRLLKRDDQAFIWYCAGWSDEDMRKRSADQLLLLALTEYSIGGLSVGEEISKMY